MIKDLFKMIEDAAIVHSPAFSVGVAMAGGSVKDGRREHDFYPTEPEAIHALIDAIQYDLEAWSLQNAKPVRFHEPACGDGAISKVLEGYGFDVLSTDLIDRGYGTGGIDYLVTKDTRPFVITNPPFYLAEEFIRKAMDDGAERVWMLLKSTYFHAKNRIDLFENTPVSRIMPLSWRLDFTGQKCPTMECAWFEWSRGHKGDPAYGPILRKPELLEKNDERCKKTIDLFE